MITESTPSGVLPAVLHIGALETRIAFGNSAAPARVASLRMGAFSLATRFFKHNPPTPFEIESAIAAIEDEIMATPKFLERHDALETTDAAVKELQDFLPMSERHSGSMTRDQVEHLFNQLAARVQGRLPSQVSLPDDIHCSATLLILRELMHHLDFDHIQLRPDPHVTV